MGIATTNDGTLEEEPSPRGSGVPLGEPHLFLLFEGTRPLAGGARWALGDVDRVTLGRASTRRAQRSVEDGERTLAIGVPDRRMSAPHARLVRAAGGAFAVEDLGSTNGSRVDGHELEAAVDLHDGDVIEVGRTFFLFRARIARSKEAPDAYSAALAGDTPDMATLVPARADAVAALRKIAASQVPVLVLGPTGAGKEVAARALHAWSRRSGRFVAVNAGALPASLVEASLFGHVKGSFTGAVGHEAGFVRAADGGTLFLDEIADLPLPAQAALLRVLQENEVVPVGATRAVTVDVRVVAATHADLEARVRAGQFREDLLARLAGFAFDVPALRDRLEDLGLLVASLLSRAAPSQLSADAARAVALHAWPRNVRELQQALASAAVLAAPGGVIELAHLPAQVAAAAAPRGAPPNAVRAGEGPDAELRRALVASLVEHRGNVAEVARALGKARMQIQRWVKRFNIDVGSFRR